LDPTQRSVCKGLHIRLLAWTLAAAVATTGEAAQPPPSDIQKVLDFDQRGPRGGKAFEVAYLIQCVNNPYCAANLEGMNAAARKYNLKIKVFDAQFSPGEQLKHVQNAVAGRFDGFILAPTAAAQACSMYRNYLQPTGKPIVVYDVPMCGDRTATAGVAGTVLMQTRAYYDSVVEAAFASCKGACEAAAVGGYVGTDLFEFWESALSRAGTRHSNVKLVVNQPTGFSPQTTARVIQDALSAHPKINLIVSQFDDISRAVLQSVRNAGRTAGKDIIIFSVGATTDGVKRVSSGEIEATAILLPYEEGYYTGVVMAMALEGQPLNGYVDESKLPVILQGPGDVLLTRSNSAKFTPYARY
jgi:galactofuranose transport system substrate-binding protein